MLLPGAHNLAENAESDVAGAEGGAEGGAHSHGVGAHAAGASAVRGASKAGLAKGTKDTANKLKGLLRAAFAGGNPASKESAAAVADAAGHTFDHSSVDSSYDFSPLPDGAVMDPMDMDIVIMWVNGTEETFVKNRAKYGGGTKLNNRDRDNGEVRMGLRSIEKFWPWFRGNIYFVHQNLPCWLNTDHPRMHAIHHRDIFLDQSNTLPTFSSDAIEAQLHRIPGISRTFILMMDDVITFKPVHPLDLVTPTGAPRLYFEKYVPHGGWKEHKDYKKRGVKNWVSKIYRTKALVEDAYPTYSEKVKADQFHFLKHSPVPLDREVLKAMWDRFPEEMALNSRQRFRSHDGLDTTFMHNHVCLFDPRFQCRAVPQKVSDSSAELVKVTTTTQNCKLLRGYLQRPETFPKWIAVNDEQGSAPAGDGWAYAEFLPFLFPEPSQWERKDKCVYRHMAPYRADARRRLFAAAAADLEPVDGDADEGSEADAGEGAVMGGRGVEEAPVEAGGRRLAQGSLKLSKLSALGSALKAWVGGASDESPGSAGSPARRALKRSRRRRRRSDDDVVDPESSNRWARKVGGDMCFLPPEILAKDKRDRSKFVELKDWIP